MPDAAGGLSLEVKDLVTAYGAIRALNGVSMTVPAGSITAVLGANGAGKSSLLRTLSGLVKPRSGSVLLDGKEIAGRA
ncbi:MAG: branched-chain amino acid transport system ATP-binding protein, partial [Frankiales bacterium]|nr:branched-chain amino acid transport system ATP-binding protein [Frankiales bacterium]